MDDSGYLKGGVGSEPQHVRVVLDHWVFVKWISVRWNEHVERSSLGEIVWADEHYIDLRAWNSGHLIPTDSVIAVIPWKMA
jgi:hypothetical protein